MAVNEDVTDVTEAQRLNHVEGHAINCVCDQCLARQGTLDRMIRSTERRAEARYAAQVAAAVPIEDRIRAEAVGAHYTAQIEADNIGRIRDKLREGVDFATRRAERVAVLYRGRNFKHDDAVEFFSATQRA